jgi:hypothetical protein
VSADADVPYVPADPSYGEYALESLKTAVRDELDQVVPHVVAALKRQDAVRDLSGRLDRAERRLAERDARPLVSGLRRVLSNVRRLELDADVRTAIVGELEGLLIGAGYNEFGDVGEAFDPVRHEALDGVASSGVHAVVLEVLEPGLETLGEVVVTAKVRIGDASPATNETEDAA